MLGSGPLSTPQQGTRLEVTDLVEQVADIFQAKLEAQLGIQAEELALGSDDMAGVAEVYVYLEGVDTPSALITVRTGRSEIVIEFPRGNKRGYVEVPLDDAAAVQLALGGNPEIVVPEAVIAQVVAGARAWLTTHRLQSWPSELDDA